MRISAGRRAKPVASNAMGRPWCQPCCARPAASSTHASNAASLRRNLSASSAKRAASSPSAASAGISARRRARVKRGSRFDGSSAKATPCAFSVATRRRFGTASSGRIRVRPPSSGQARFRLPWRRDPSVRCRGQGASARFQLGRRACVPSGCLWPRPCAPQRPAAGSAPAGRLPVSRSAASFLVQRMVRCATAKRCAKAPTVFASRADCGRKP